jgi:hypothetical protein
MLKGKSLVPPEVRLVVPVSAGLAEKSTDDSSTVLGIDRLSWESYTFLMT